MKSMNSLSSYRPWRRMLRLLIRLPAYSCSSVDERNNVALGGEQGNDTPSRYRKSTGIQLSKSR